MRKNALFSSIITAAIVMTFVIGTVSPTFALESRKDGPTTVTDNWQGAQVGVQLTGEYGPEPPNRDTYDKGQFALWRSTSSELCHLVGNFYVYVRMENKDEGDAWLEFDSFYVTGDVYDSEWIAGTAGTWAFDQILYTAHWLEATNILYAHYP